MSAKIREADEENGLVDLRGRRGREELRETLTYIHHQVQNRYLTGSNRTAEGARPGTLGQPEG